MVSVTPGFMIRFPVGAIVRLRIVVDEDTITVPELMITSVLASGRVPQLQLAGSPQEVLTGFQVFIN